MRTVGIDLGTTNTVVAVDLDVLEPELDGAVGPLLPSVVAFPPDGMRTVGRTAKLRRAIDPKNTLYSTKRIIGRPWLSRDVRSFREDYPFELDNRGGQPVFRTRAGEFTPTDIGAMVVRAAVEGALQDPATLDVVVGVPSMFEDEQRRQTVEACRQGGLTNVRVIDEPVATAAAYMRTVPQDAHRVLTYDFGGGTFDVAVVDCSRDPFRVLAHGGDAYLGGDDIDRAIAKHVAGVVLERHGWDLTSERTTFEHLQLVCEYAKIELSHRDSVPISVGQVDKAAPQGLADVELDRALVEQLCLKFVSSSFIVCDEVLREARVRPQDIDIVIAAGGTTAAPVVRRYVGQYFGKEPLCDIDPRHVVAIGASVCLDVSGTIRPPY